MTDTHAPLAVVQITDTHLMSARDVDQRGWLTAHSLEAVLAAVSAEGVPDLVLATGDLAEDTSANTYALIERMFAQCAAPVWSLPGNHDDPARVRALPGPGSAQRPGYGDLGGWRFVLLDSHVPGEVGGRLGREQLTALDELLRQASERPTLVAVHHPPLSLGSPWMDGMSLEDGPELLALLEGHPQVRVLLFGHAHQAFEAQRDALQILGAPSTCYQFLPGAERFALDDATPGWRRLWLYPDGRVESRVGRLDRSYRVN